MQKIKRLIIILSVLLVSAIGLIIIFTIINKKEVEEEAKIDVITYNKEFYIEHVDNAIDFYTVKNICNSYIDNILYEDSEELYNMIDKSYIQEFQITTDNVIEKISNLNYDIDKNGNLELDFVVKDMKSTRNDNSIYVFFVSGNVIDNIEHQKTDFACMVEMDKNNNTFYILPKSYMEKNKYIDIKVGESYNIEIEEIESNGYDNKYDDIIITEEEIIEGYLEEFKDSVLYDKNEAYSMLDEEYRTKKFGNYQNFEKYLDENIREIMLYKLEEYNVSSKDDYVRYILANEEEKYYLCNRYSLAKYSFFLDDYVIPTPEFIEKYNSTTEQGKIILNIDKFIKAINDKSYYYAYNCLSEGFRNNYFKTLEDFEEYIKESLYNNVNIEYDKFEKEGELFKYRINIINAENEEEIQQKTIIMKLDEGTDFEMSFNVE